MNNFYNYRFNNTSPYNLVRHSPPQPPSSSPKCSPPKKKKFDFKSLKKDTCTSLCDVEHFLCNFSSFVKYVKLYDLLKK